MTGKLSTAGRAVPNSLYLSLPPLSKNFRYELLCTNLQHSTAQHGRVTVTLQGVHLLHAMTSVAVDMKFAWSKLAVTDVKCWTVHRSNLYCCHLPRLHPMQVDCAKDLDYRSRSSIIRGLKPIRLAFAV